jgi:hypothetical protein
MPSERTRRTLLPTTCRYQLVGDPFRRWVRCDAEPQDLSPAVPHVSLANPLWGAPRIHGELLRLGIDVGQTSVAKYMVRRRGPPSQCHRHDCAGTSSSPDQQAIKEAPSDHGLGQTMASAPPTPRAAGLDRRQSKKLFCRDPTSRRGSSDSASLANCMEFTTGTATEAL